MFGWAYVADLLLGGPVSSAGNFSTFTPGELTHYSAGEHALKIKIWVMARNLRLRMEQPFIEEVSDLD